MWNKKSFNLEKNSKVDKKISLFAMISIALLAIFNFQNVIDNYVGLGLSASVAFAIAVALFLFPFIFIIAEFASLIKGTKSGLTSWIQTSVGRKTAFLTSFMFWFANLTFFFSAVPSRINYLSFAVTGQDFTKDTLYNQIIPWIAVAFFLVITLISTLNTKKISKITSLGGGLMIGITLFFFLFAIIGWIAGSINPSLLGDVIQAPGIEGSKPDIWGESGGLGFGWISTFIWVLMAADGGQTLGVYVNDVKGGKKTFVRAMLISVTIIGFSYVFGTLLASVFPPIGGLASGWADSFLNLFLFITQGADPRIVAKFTYITIGLILFISSVGGLIVWTSAPVKVMFSEISTGVFGQTLAKENKNGVCSFGTWIQFLIVVPLMLFLMLSKGDLSSSLVLIKGAAGWIGLLPWLIIFISYVNLRWKKEYEERGFKMCNRRFGIGVGVLLATITSAILALTFLDTAPLDKPYSQWDKDWYLGPVLKIVMIILILVPAYMWYYFKFEYQIRDAKVANRLNISQNSIVLKYNFISNLKYKYLYNSEYQMFEYEKTKLLLLGKEKLNNLYEKMDDIQKMINSSSNKSLKTKFKKLKKEVSREKKNIKKEIKKQKNELNKNIKILAIKDKKNYSKEYNNVILKYVNDLKNQEKNNKHNVKLKQQIKETKTQIKQQIKRVSQDYKNQISKIDKNNNKKEYINLKKQCQLKINDLYKQYYETKIYSPYSELMIENLNTSIEKDIDFDGESIEMYLKNKNEEKIFETTMAFDYGFASSKKFNDKVVLSNNKMLLIKDNANSLVGKQYDLKNIKLIVKSKDSTIKVIHEGEWIDLEKIEFIHVENSQIESFNIFVPDSKPFVEILGKK